MRVNSSKDILVNCCCAGHFIAAVVLGWVFEVVVRERNVLGYCCGSEFNAGVVFSGVHCACRCGVGFGGVVFE